MDNRKMGGKYASTKRLAQNRMVWWMALPYGQNTLDDKYIGPIARTKRYGS